MSGATAPRRVALVTGASGGIGGAVARRLAVLGVDLALLDRDPAPTVLIEALEAAGAQVLALERDLSQPEEIAGAVEEAARRLGPVSCLVNNAGLTAEVAPVGEISRGAWEREIAVNLSAPLYLTQAALPAMIAQGWGRIVNVSSMAARGGLFHQAGYSATKTGLLGLTRNVALEHARDGITCNAVLPGLIATPAVLNMPAEVRDDALALVPAQRLGLPEEIARQPARDRRAPGARDGGRCRAISDLTQDPGARRRLASMAVRMGA